jgi:hypothetical protein
MSFYIKFENNSADGHPSALENLQQLYPNFLDDPQSLGYYSIEIVRPPIVSGSFPTTISVPQYQMENNTASMYYITRQMTQQEKQHKYNAMLDAGYIYTGWILNPDTLFWEPPIPCPDSDQNTYTWSNETQSWILVTE